MGNSAAVSAIYNCLQSDYSPAHGYTVRRGEGQEDHHPRGEQELHGQLMILSSDVMD